MLEWLEFEEKVGRWWHRWASSRSNSYPHYPHAAVKLESIAGPLAVFFRASGGANGVSVAAVAARSSSHRLNLRQRLGFDEEVLNLSRLDEENLLLPPEIALFEDTQLNRDLYFWLAALLAATTPIRVFNDPLRQDISGLRQVVSATEAALLAFPGLQERHARLRQGLLAIRPPRSLPPVEAAMEAVICHLLGDSEPLLHEAQRYFEAVMDSGIGLREFRAPPDYRRPLPVPLWANLASLGTSIAPADGDDDEQTELPPAARRKHKANARLSDVARIRPIATTLWSSIASRRFSPLRKW